MVKMTFDEITPTLTPEEERELEELDPQIELSLKSRPDIARAMMAGMLIKWTQNSESLTKTLRTELGIITGEPMNAITDGGNFKVRLHEVKLDELDAAGEIYWSPTGNPRRKVFCDPSKGIPIQDIWLNYRDSINQAQKTTGYPTEKNYEMLKMIVFLCIHN